MTGRIAVIGIDSMDRDLVEANRDRLPFFSRLIDETPAFRSESVFPPDSDTAWASIYTGLNPARHGVVNFVDPLEKASIYQTDYLTSAAVRGRTFWDVASTAGHRICLLMPHVAYPVWEVNGIMISRIPKKGGFAVWPPEREGDFSLEGLEIPLRIPNSKAEYADYLATFTRTVEAEFAFAEQMFEEESWSLFFFYSSALDFIQHIFWSFSDPADPMYPGDENPYRHTVLDFYALYDRELGRLSNRIGSDMPLLVLSDHGHGLRPNRLFNVNELLRQHDYLAVHEGVINPVNRLSERVKHMAVDIAQRTALRATALKLLRRFPAIKDLYTVPSLIDFDRTIARCTDLSGMKAYSYGGILIAGDRLKPTQSYESVRDDLIRLLSESRIPGTDRPLFKWVVRREDLYDGEFITRYPDVVFHLAEAFGAGWGVQVPLFTNASAHSFFPGTHRASTPVFHVLNGPDAGPLRLNVRLVDVAPTVLALLGLGDEDRLSFDGTSLYGNLGGGGAGGG
jgi:predicted AlkP superfamily phosphohydrolase/phosphomutase